MRVLSERLRMGFHRSQRESSFGLHFTCTSTRRGTRSTAGSGAGTRKRLRIPGKLEPSGPEGGRAEGRGAARKPKGSRRGGVPRGRGPFSGPHPRAKAGEGRCRKREGGRTYSAVLLREEVGAVVQAFLRGWRGPARRGRGRSRGDTKRDISARPPRPPRPPPARRAHRAPRDRRRRRTPTIMAAPK